MAIRSLKSGSFSRSTQVGNSIILPGDYESIATVTVGAGGASSIDFTSISGSYKHLQLRVIGRGNNADTNDDLQIRFNSDTNANYAWHALTGDGASAYAGAASATSNTRVVRLGGNTGNASTFGVGVVDILDYANTNKYKTIRTLTGLEMNGSGYVDLRSLLWTNTSAITSINLTSRYGTGFLQYSSFALYGIRG